MKGLIVKDLYNLRKEIKSLILYLGLFLFISIYLKTPLYILVMSTLLPGMMVINALAYDDKYGWDTYALVLPIKKPLIVVGKFLLQLIMSSLGWLLGFIIGLFLIKGEANLGLKEYLISSFIVYLLANLYISILTYLTYRFGVERSRMVNIILIGFLAGLGGLVYSLIGYSRIINNLGLVILFFVIFTIIIYVTCIWRSILIYTSRDY